VYATSTLLQYYAQASSDYHNSLRCGEFVSRLFVEFNILDIEKILQHLSTEMYLDDCVMILCLRPFLFFLFCNHAFIVFRYKKPHALAMDRTKPIKQKYKQKKVTARVNIHDCEGFSSAGSKTSYKGKLKRTT